MTFILNNFDSGLLGVFDTKEKAINALINYFCYQWGVSFDGNHIYVEDERLYSDEEEMDGAPDTRQTMFSQIFKNNEFMFWDSDYYYVQEVSMNSMLPDYQPQTLMELENCTQIPEGL